MKTLEIKGFPRTQTGKKETKKIRSQGQVPCVVYGGDKNIHFSSEVLDLKKLVYTQDTYLVKIEIDGNTYESVLQETQFHPVSEEILHMDFVQVFSDKKVIVNLPIVLKGISIGIKEGGKLRQRRRYIKVQGLIKDMPDVLEVDMTELDIGDFLKIADLNYNNLEILDPAKAMVVGVVSSRLIAKGMEEEVIEEEVVEGEVPEEGEEDAEAGETPEGADEGSAGTDSKKEG
jgi:large subunit ribosomal protein L25